MEMKIDQPALEDRNPKLEYWRDQHPYGWITVEPAIPSYICKFRDTVLHVSKYNFSEAKMAK